MKNPAKWISAIGATTLLSACATVPKQAVDEGPYTSPAVLAYQKAETFEANGDVEAMIADIRNRMGCMTAQTSASKPQELPVLPQVPSFLEIPAEAPTDSVVRVQESEGIRGRLKELENTVCYWTEGKNRPTEQEGALRFQMGMGEWLYETAEAEGCANSTAALYGRPCTLSTVDMALSKNGAAYSVYADYFTSVALEGITGHLTANLKDYGEMTPAYLSVLVKPFEDKASQVQERRKQLEEVLRD